MTKLKDILENDLHTAMRARDELRTATLRMLLSAVKNEEVAGRSARVLSDDEVLKVVIREVKKRTEAAGVYRDADRTALADREEAEKSVLETYLPVQLSDDELGLLVQEAVTESGATAPKQMGLVMKVLTPRVAGRADGKRVSEMVRAQLS